MNEYLNEQWVNPEHFFNCLIWVWWLFPICLFFFVHFVFCLICLTHSLLLCCYSSYHLICVLLNIAEANIFHACSFKSSGVCNQVYCPSVCDQEEESVLMSRGSHACPCVESIQGSSLLPVNVERKITLVGRNLHLYQVMQRLEACWSLIV